MAIKFNRSQTFATGGTVTSAALHNLIDGTDIYPALITDQSNLATISTADKLLIADTDDTINAKSTTVQNLFDQAFSGGTYTQLNLTGNLTFGTTTGNRTVSTSATITNGTIPNLTAGTTTGTLATLTNSNITNGTIQTLTSSTATITGGTFSGSVNSTAGTIGTLNSTTGTIGNLSTTLAGDLAISQGTATLGTSGVTASSYGTTSEIPRITVDAKGRITSATTVTAPVGFRNRIINGDMRIDQRNAGAAVTANTSFAVDRFQLNFSNDGACSLQQSSTAPSGFTNSIVFTTTTADASLGSTQSTLVTQRIEGYNISDLGFGASGASSVTLSFWVRSSLTGTFGGSLQNNNSDRNYPFAYEISSANTWEKKTISIAGDTSGTWLTNNGVGIQLHFGLGSGSSYSGTAGSWTSSNVHTVTGAVSVIGTLNATWYITGVQLEAGSTATEFERRPYGTELALCQRYYYLLVNGSTQPIYSGFNASTTRSYGNVYFPVTMRTNPVLISTSGTNYYETYQGTGTIKSSAIVQDLVSQRGSSLYSDTTGLTTGYGNFFYSISANSFVAFSAEL